MTRHMLINDINDPIFGDSLTYINVTDTIDSETGSKTAEGTSETAFIGIFVDTVEDNSSSKAGPLSTGQKMAVIPTSLSAKIKDRIRTAAGDVYEIETIEREIDHDEVILTEYTRV